MVDTDCDSDFVLALRLQEKFDRELLDNAAVSALAEPWDVESKTDNKYEGASSNIDTSTMSLVDPRWEMIDPIPDVRALFIEFNAKYFWGKLAAIEVRWSPRMTLCAGLCVYEGHGGMCSVRLSEPLLKLRPRKDLIETLLHEMIHAYLFVTQNNKDHDGHGPEFHKHMYRLNTETGTNISVYHTFHDEVDNYRQHWWKCDGPCQKKNPYFGYVKRSMNRAPSPNDPWWADHQRTCGGTYTKVKEPEGYSVKRKISKGDTNTDKPSGAADIRKFGKSKNNGGFGEETDNKIRSGTSSTTQTGQDKMANRSKINGIMIPVNNSAEDAENRRPNLFDIGVNSRVKGFESGTKNTTEMIKSREDGPNIYGFGKLHPGENNENKRQTNNSSFPTSKFLGGSKTLGGKRNGEMGAEGGVIFRRIPGIGVVTTERFLGHQTSTASAVEPKSPDIDENHTKLDKSLQPENSSVKKAVIDYNSEDSDFDEFLDGLLKSEIQKSKKKHKVSGDKNNMQSFTSVSNHKRLEDPEKRYLSGAPLPKSKMSPKTEDFLHAGSSKSLSVISPDSKTHERKQSTSSGHPKAETSNPVIATTMHSKNVDSKARDNVNNVFGNGVSSVNQPTIKRKMPTDFAVDRNKRAMFGVSDSESDSELDENLTLGALLKNKVQNSVELPMKRLRLDDLPRKDSEHSHQNIASIANGVDLQAGGAQGGDNITDTVNCPVCRVKVKQSLINDHLDTCLLSADF